jgi:hypothetical protein
LSLHSSADRQRKESDGGRGRKGESDRKRKKSDEMKEREDGGRWRKSDRGRERGRKRER